MFLSESRIGITNFEISYISTNRFPNQMYQYKNNSLLQFYSCKETLQSDFLPYEHVQRETRSSLYANIYDFFHLSTLTFRLIFFSPALPPATLENFPKSINSTIIHHFRAIKAFQ